MKKGFTLLELMVVIGIIAILAAILLKSVGGSTDSARAAKCLSNMHNLAAACQTVAMRTGYYPLAGSKESTTISVQKSASGLTSEHPGWVSWASYGRYKKGTKGHQASSGWFMSTYNNTLVDRVHALTNGTIWKAISGNASAYRCPLHAQFAKKKKLEPVWSYVMNSWFGWDTTEGARTGYGTGAAEHSFRSVTDLDRRLLFAELAFNTDLSEDKRVSFHPSIQFSTGSGTTLDPTLQYESSYNEMIGFNHKTSKKWYAHVCFVDGHTEKLELPRGAGAGQIQELTKWLCEGTEFGLSGTQYEELKK